MADEEAAKAALAAELSDLVSALEARGFDRERAFRYLALLAHGLAREALEAGPSVRAPPTGDRSVLPSLLRARLLGPGGGQR